MNIKLLAGATCLALTTASTSFAASVTYGGVTFAAGDVAFADAVVSYTPGLGVSGTYDDPLDALGAPDYNSPNGSVSLGNPNGNTYGELILQFTDNSLTTSGDASADLHIFEIGGAVELMGIFIAKTLADPWVSLGQLSGQPTSIDIDAISGVELGALYSFVKITDVAGGPYSGSPYSGPDIDAVGAISSGVAVSTVPVPAAGLLLLTALGGLGLFRRRKKPA